jgi:hypothetical protein
MVCGKSGAEADRDDRVAALGASPSTRLLMSRCGAKRSLETRKMFGQGFLEDGKGIVRVSRLAKGRAPRHEGLQGRTIHPPRHLLNTPALCLVPLFAADRAVDVG